MKFRYFNTNKIVNLLSACKEIGVIINPPDINHSQYRFEPVKNKTISYGLCAIKGVGESAAKHIGEIREKYGYFESIDDFCTKVNLNTVNSGTMESLISSGCFDNISYKSRSFNIDNLNNFMSYGHKKQIDLASGQSELFSSDQTTPKIQEDILMYLYEKY